MPVVKRTVGLDTIYQLPQSINIVQHRGKFIVIAPECANYIVLDNEDQVSFYNLLYENSIGTALSSINILESDARNVVTQIEARRFDNTLADEVRGVFQLQLHVTNACNMRCPHCYMYSGKPDSGELSLIEIKKLLDSFKSHGGHFVIFSGGEVLVRSDFSEIVKYASSLNLSINIMSNGVLWTQELINELAPCIASIQISIDGYNEETNAPIRGVGNFAKALLTVERFLAKNIHTVIAITPWLDDSLESRIPHYIAFRRELEERYPTPNLEIKFNGDLMSGRDISVQGKEHQKYASSLRKIMFAEQHETMAEDVLVYKMQGKVINKNWCTYGHLTIAPKGDVYLCGKITQCGAIGNIRDLGADEIMRLSRKARTEAEVTNIEPCRMCGLRYICGGDCRIIEFDYFKDGKNHLNEDSDKIRKWRICPPGKKQYWYDLMLAANEKLYQ